ncbi:MAG: WYL domain-containing protein, partial [Planctomycetia bacterium]|nr:WYL domain-containing protein [Planctomycetia bacterium]
AWAVRMPSYSIVPILRRRLEPGTLRRILEAIRTRSSIRIHYQSKSSPRPKWRRIAPHALGFDGFRWHARAWCHEHEEFRDFVLTRILEIDDARSGGVDPAKDAGWQREVTLRLAPHPRLKGGDRRAVELDFGMTDGIVEVRMRVCMAYYFMHQLGLDGDGDDFEPESHQLVLLNRADVEAEMKAAGRC